MSLEDYIRQQEQKAKAKASDIKSDAKDAWQKTKRKTSKNVSEIEDRFS